MRIRRLAWLAPFPFMVAGAALAALERWRPEVVEPTRHRIYVALSAYLYPIRAGAERGGEFGGRVAELWKVRQDYEAMERRAMRLEAELQATREQVLRLGRISGLSQWANPSGLEFVPADVIGFTTEDQSETLTLNRGRRDGVREGLPVVGQKGLAGVVREVSERSARVQGILDPLSAIGVVDARTRRRGIVFGRGRESDAEFIPENEIQPIVPGTVLITSGLDNSIYPKGLVVGRIKGKTQNKRGMVYGVIEPAENFNALEEALVIRPSERPAGAAPAPGLKDSLGRFALEMTSSTLPRAEAPGAREAKP